MQLTADLVDPEQHYAEKTSFKEEGGQHFIRHQRPDHRPGLVRKHRPVGAELIGHDNARDDTHRENYSENLQPIAIEVSVNAFAGLEPKPFENGKKARKPNREGRKQKVEADSERELHAREY